MERAARRVFGLEKGLMKMPPSEPPDGIFVTWGLLQWFIAGLGGIVLALGAFIWRIGVRLGAFQTEFDAMQADVQSRRDRLEDKIDALEQSDRALERAVAELPDKIMTRINGGFDNIHRRIDGLLSRVPTRE